MNIILIFIACLVFPIQKNSANTYNKTHIYKYKIEGGKFDKQADLSSIKQRVDVNTINITEEINPEVNLTTPEMIARNGYPAESHTVRTEDGYLLTLHRIPRGKKLPSNYIPQKTVILHHGLLCSSADWVINGPSQSLAYILSDAGYDVWMGNARGNTYSRAHVSLDIDSLAFWDFTWHEIGTRDLPAVIDYIDAHKFTSDKIHYVGHSMGTTVLFVLLSSRPEYNQKLHAGYALAPVSYMSDLKSPIKFIAPIANIIYDILSHFKIYNILPHNILLHWLLQNFCMNNEYQKRACLNAIFDIIGHDEPQIHWSQVPIILGHTPAGASSKTLKHYAQMINGKTIFQQFDYGTKGNMIHYNSQNPPAYPLEKITLPVSLLCSRNDWFVEIGDVKKLYKKLNNSGELYTVPLEMFTHLDFLWAKDAPKLVYDKLQKMMLKK